MARTTLDLDEALVDAAVAAAGARTKTEAIETALRELIRNRQREKLRRELGTFEIDLTLEQLRRNRRAG